MESSHLYLFFGGSYSNIHALNALKKEAEKLNVLSNNIYHTGDVVGYCASPNETVNAVREWGINVIAGNVEIQLRDGKKIAVVILMKDHAVLTFQLYGIRMLKCKLMNQIFNG